MNGQHGDYDSKNAMVCIQYRSPLLYCVKMKYKSFTNDILQLFCINMWLMIFFILNTKHQ